MRMTIEIDSANATEAQQLIFAFQRMRNRVGAENLPASLTREPTCRMAGIGWGVTLPSLTQEQAEIVMADFHMNHPLGAVVVDIKDVLAAAN